MSVRQRLLGLVLLAALASTGVAAVAALSSRSVDRAARQEHAAVSLRERYLHTEAVLAQVRGAVYEVVVTHEPGVEEDERAESLAEYAELRGLLDELAAATPTGVPRGPLLASATSVGAQARALLAVADDTVEAAGTRPELTAAGLDELDAVGDPLDVALDGLVAELADVQGDAVQKTSAYRRFSATAVIATSVAGVLALLALALLAASSIVRGLREVADAAARLAEGDFEARYGQDRRDEIGELGQAFDATADSLKDMVRRLEQQRRQDAFGQELDDALEMADTEEQTYDALRLALSEVSAGHPVELLVADSSRAHLQSRAEHPEAGGPCCPVESPFGCVAVRRGTTTTFPDSRALNACHKLRDRGGEPLAAVCIPVTFMGRALGVLHSTAPVATPPDAEEVARLATVAGAAGGRIGTVRSFERTQLQASTDGLTGLVNRRTFETTARAIVARGGRHAVVMADVDHFKLINDTHGHEAGDRALVLFAQQLRAHLRRDDVLARYGGEEFALLLPACTAAQAVELLDRFRVGFAATTAHRPPAFTASFGVVDSEHPDSLAGMLKRADDALYRAKAAGRDRVVLGGTEPAGEQHADSAWERALREDDPLADAAPLR